MHSSYNELFILINELSVFRPRVSLGISFKIFSTVKE